MTVRGPTSIRLIFSRGCFRIETSGIISPRSPCVVSLIVRMAYLSRNSTQEPINEQSEVSIQPLGGEPEPIDEDNDSISNCVQLDSDTSKDQVENSVTLFLESSRAATRKPALLERPLLFKVPSLKHFSRIAVNKFNLRNFANEALNEYIHQYPYPI